MDNYTMIYNLIYALAAINGREKRLFGNCAATALQEFEFSLAQGRFPELWFEFPLLGDPWFDLHMLFTQDDLAFGDDKAIGPCAGHPEMFEWFAAQKSGARQLAVSWDTSSGDVSHPALQLLVWKKDPQVTCDFLSTAKRSDAVLAYRTFVDSLPEDWFACYAGVFPRRTTPFLRVECIPKEYQQREYAQNIDLLEEHLRQVGFTAFGDTLLERCQTLAKTPFQLEFQFDVNEDGTAGSTLSASVRFSAADNVDWSQPFDPNGAAGELMRTIEEWGLTDDRWQLMADTAFAKGISRSGESSQLFCFPAFIKLRWRDGQPLDAKAYLMAGIQ